MHQIHSLKTLADYNLFTKKENKLIKKALFVERIGIEIELLQNISIPVIKVFYYNYDKINPQNNFELIEIKNFKTHIYNKIIIIPVDLGPNYVVEVNDEQINVILDPSVGGILDTVYNAKNESNFGVELLENKASFKLWSPPAQKVRLILFDKNQNEINSNQIYLSNSKPGIWTCEIEPQQFNLNSLEELYYQYEIFAYGKKTIGLDPFAKSIAVFNPAEEDNIGKAAIINTNSPISIPENFNNTFSNFKFIENELDLIAYEVHVRDFTIQPGVVEKNIAGTYKGFEHKAEYLKELGITHVQLLPVHKCFTSNEKNREYTGIDSQISNYNWGYDPMNYFTIEGRYSTDPTNPYCRIKEFRQLIQTLHNKGIGVIMDVVFNHTFLSETFEDIAPGCFYRLKNDYSISGHTGAGSSLESRRIFVKNFIIESLNYFVKEYHIDGFRFDLMSFHDHNLMREIRQQVGKIYNPQNINELILQGEAWNFTDISDNSAYTKTNFPNENLNIALFNDIFRDACAGVHHHPGFVQANKGESAKLATGITGACKDFDKSNFNFSREVFYNIYNLFAYQPSDCLNYISIHDGLTLWDKINLSIKDVSKIQRLKAAKFAAAILFTSQGKIIWHGGDEILRSKPLAKYDKEASRAFTSEFIDEEENSLFFHENSYQSVDYTNMFRWNRLSNEFEPFAKEMLEFVKKLIQLRRKNNNLRIVNSNDIAEKLKFIGSDINEKVKDTTLLNINSFKNSSLEKLKIKFVNGPILIRYYLTGEIHEKDPNPIENPFFVDFDETGCGKIEFTRSQIDNFDLTKWDWSPRLDFKLVKTPGSWDFPANCYTEYGRNSICPNTIPHNFEVKIDLSSTDYWHCLPEPENPDNFIAFVIDSDKSKSEKRIIVIHNSSTLELDFENSLLHKAGISQNDINNYDFLCSDSQYIKIKTSETGIIVPGTSSLILVEK